MTSGPVRWRSLWGMYEEVDRLFFLPANPDLFFVYFWSFQTKSLQFFTTNQCEKMSVQYTALGFKPTTFRT